MPSVITTGWRSVQTEYADTLASIAFRELQDASRWPEIAWLNNLLPPYLTTDASDPRIALGRLIVAGGVIKIPIPTAKRQGITPAESFGIDVSLKDGELEASAAGDFVVASGVANLRQALEIRLRSDYGCLPFHPKYGNAANRLRGRKADGNTALLALRFCEECLLADPRVVSVSDGSAEQDGDAIRIFVAAVVDDGTPLRLQLEI